MDDLEKKYEQLAQELKRQKEYVELMYSGLLHEINDGEDRHWDDTLIRRITWMRE